AGAALAFPQSTLPPRPLANVPEKWEPVFRIEHAQNQNDRSALPFDAIGMRSGSRACGIGCASRLRSVAAGAPARLPRLPRRERTVATARRAVARRPAGILQPDRAGCVP